MEFCEQSLSKRLKCGPSHGSLPEAYIRSFISNIIPTLGRLHNMGYAHLDIKSDNILISQKRRIDPMESFVGVTPLVKTRSDDGSRFSDRFSTSPRSTFSNANYLLADFGLCTKISEADSHFDVIVGDKAYMPMEVIRRALDPSFSVDLTKVDIFSFGLILLQLMSGIDIPVQEPQWSLLRTKEYVTGLIGCTNYSSKLKELAIRCLSPEPAERPSTAQILAGLVDKTQFLAKSLEIREEVRINKRVELLQTTRASSPLKRNCSLNFMASIPYNS